jgi:hypothetical protein
MNSFRNRVDDTLSLASARKFLPLFAAMNQTPKVNLVVIGAGAHLWSYYDSNLPVR